MKIFKKFKAWWIKIFNIHEHEFTGRIYNHHGFIVQECSNPRCFQATFHDSYFDNLDFEFGCRLRDAGVSEEKIQKTLSNLKEARKKENKK